MLLLCGRMQHARAASNTEAFVRIYVGNMSYQTTPEGLRSAFEAHGAVDEATLVTDRETGRPRGFGFVSMPNDDEGRKAIEAIDQTDLDGRTLKVNEARPRESPGGGGGGGWRR